VAWICTLLKGGNAKQITNSDYAMGPKPSGERWFLDF
jgi:hypothetical protein